MRTTTVQFLWRPEEEIRLYFKQQLKDVKGLVLEFPTTEEYKNKSFPKLSNANVVIGWRFTESMIPQLSQCQLIINPGAGVRQVVQFFQKHHLQHQIKLCNSHGNAYASAQHALALLLALSNKVVRHHNFLQGGKWRTGEKEGKSILLKNRKIGFLGYGAVNQKVHQFLSGFNLDFYALRSKWKETPNELKTYYPNQLNDFLNEIDVLIVALPHTESTENLIGQEELKLLGKNALLVNIGRGPVINEKALYNALNNNVISGAAIDVWYNYRPEENEQGQKFPFNYPFNKLENMVLSPHRAASPMDDIYRFDDCIENIIRFANQKTLVNVVNISEGY